MKEVMAIIRMNMIGKTKDALANEGFPAMTCRKVYGRGKKKVVYEMLQGVLVNSTQPLLKGDLKTVAEQLSEEHTLMPKRLITIVINDEDVDRAVRTIIAVNQKGRPGDGKIFVFDIDDVIRVRTGERGRDAV